MKAQEKRLCYLFIIGSDVVPYSNAKKILNHFDIVEGKEVLKFNQTFTFTLHKQFDINFLFSTKPADKLSRIRICNKTATISI